MNASLNAFAPGRRYSARVCLCLALLASLMLPACADQGGPIKKEHVGTLLGAAGGAALGAQFGKGTGNIVGIAAGTLAGAMIGNAVGTSLDRADQAHMAKHAQTSLEYQPSGKTTTWHNPDSGHSGTMTPVRTFERDGAYCREYRQTVRIGKDVQEAYGTACRQPDGTWKIVD